VAEAAEHGVPRTYIRRMATRGIVKLG